MKFRLEIAAHLAVVAVLCLGSPTVGAADTGPSTTDTSDGSTMDTAADETSDADATATDTATMGGGDTGSADAADTAMPDTADTGAPDVSDTGTPDTADTGAPDVSDTGTPDTADTGAPDVSDTGTQDVADTGPADAADTAAPDVADTGPADTADAPDTTADVVDADMGDAVDVAPDDADAEPTLARFFGGVQVRSKPDDGGVTITVTRTDGDLTREQTTERGGEFAFEELPLGTYEVEVSLENYVTIAETFELEGDREARYTLHRDQNVDVRIRALFDHVEEPPEEVSFVLESDRGRRTPEGGAVAVDEGEAAWTVSELGVGTWTLTASAETFRDVSFRFGATGPNGPPEQLDLRLHMPNANVKPPPADTSGCACRRGSGGGGGGGGGLPRTPGGPVGAPFLILCSLWVSYRLLSSNSGSRD